MVLGSKLEKPVRVVKFVSTVHVKDQEPVSRFLCHQKGLDGGHRLLNTLSGKLRPTCFFDTLTRFSTDTPMSRASCLI
jgi:hypothetical protein